MGSRRDRLGGLAKTLRADGETIQLLIDTTALQAKTFADTNTALSIIDEQAQRPFNTDTVVPTYGRVASHKLAAVSFDQGGALRITAATIELQVSDQGTARQAWAVRLKSGEILRIESRNLSEGKDAYVLEVAEETPPTSGLVG